jgi:hypothetical protein
MSVSPTASAYEVAVDFIRLTDIVRLRQKVGLALADQAGWEPAASTLQELVDCRYHLDRVLSHGQNWAAWTDEAWTGLVRARLTTADSRPAVAGL